MFSMKIKTSGAAFMNPYTGEYDSICEAIEIERILRKVLKDLETDAVASKIYDINGNLVGEWDRR